MPDAKKTLPYYFLVTVAAYLCSVVHIILPTPGGSGLYLAANYLSWIFISLLITIGLWQITKAAKIRYSPTLIVLTLACLLLSIPLLYAFPFTEQAVPRVIVLFAGLIFLLSLMQIKLTNSHKEQLLYIMLFSVGIELFIGLTQLYILMPFNIEISGYTPIKQRPYGTFLQPNVMASFIATGTALALYLIKVEINKNTSFIKNSLLYFTLFSAPLLLITLQSKTGYLGFILVLLIWLSIMIKKINFYKKPLLLILAGVFVGILTLKNTQMVDRGEKLYSDKGVRYAILYTSTSLIAENPILGIGYGSFERKYLEAHKKIQESDANFIEPQKNLNHPHNEIILWWLEGGVVAFIAIAIILVAFIRLIFLRSTTCSFDKKLALISLILPITLHTQTEYPFYHSISHMIYFIIFGWLIIEELDQFKEKDVLNSRWLQPIIVILLPLISLFMLTAIDASQKVVKYNESKSTDISQLQDIINPIIWFEYIDMLIYSKLLMNSLENKNIEGLVTYIKWADNYTKHSPRHELYKNMLLAIELLEREEITLDASFKKNVYQEAIKFYPDKFKITHANN